MIENTSYAPYGQILEGGQSSRYQYEGKEFDSVVGDTDFNFRKYDQDLGIFTQPDTLIQNVYDPQSLNRYMFERGNPYKYVDEDGHYVQAVAAWIVIRAIFGAVSEGITDFNSQMASGTHVNYKRLGTQIMKGLGKGATIGAVEVGFIALGVFGGPIGVIGGVGAAVIVGEEILANTWDISYKGDLRSNDGLQPTTLTSGRPQSTIYENYYSSIVLSQSVESNEAQTDLHKGGSSSGGGSSYTTPHQYSYDNPKEYPKDDEGVCERPKEYWSPWLN